VIVAISPGCKVCKADPVPIAATRYVAPSIGAFVNSLMPSAIHRALADVGVADRFVPLQSDGQEAAFIFGRPDAIKAAAQELALTLGQELDAARKSGRAFEEQVCLKVSSDNGWLVDLASLPADFVRQDLHA